MKRLSLLLAGLLAISWPAAAHQDRILRLSPDGTLREVPAQFGQARLILAGLGTKAPAVTLRIGTHENVVPTCLTGLLQTTSTKDIQITSSWYHDQKVLPYYLVVTFFDPGRDQEKYFNSGYSLMFNLNDAKLIKVKRLKRDWFGDGGRHIDINPRDVCGQSDNRGVV